MSLSVTKSKETLKNTLGVRFFPQNNRQTLSTHQVTLLITAKYCSVLLDICLGKDHKCLLLQIQQKLENP